MNDTFECAQWCDERWPDDLQQWPEEYRLASDAAIARFLDHNPGTRVIEDTSICIEDFELRRQFDWLGHPFILIRTIKLDREVDIDRAS